MGPHRFSFGRQPRWQRGLVVAGACLAGIVGMAAGQQPNATASKPMSDILLGDATNYQHGAQVDVDQVMAVIPEWTTIQARGLTPEHAEYHLLLAQANAALYNAVRSVARAAGYDFVARQGSPVTAGLNLPDITAACIAHVTGG